MPCQNVTWRLLNGYRDTTEWETRKKFSYPGRKLRKLILPEPIYDITYRHVIRVPME